MPARDVSRVWHLVRDHLERGVARTPKLLMSQLATMLLEDRMYLWMVVTPTEVIGAFVTQVTDFPNCRTAQVVLAGGRQADLWIPLIGKLESWARHEGCQHIEILGRRGWARLLPEYQPVEYVIGKEL